MEKVVSYFLIVNSDLGPGAHNEHVIQTIWEPCRGKAKNERQCKIYVMNFSTFWTGILTREMWEEQREDTNGNQIEESQYRRLTEDAFSGVEKSGGYNLLLQVKSSKESPDDLELTWTGFSEKTLAGQVIQPKSRLGSMQLERVPPEKSQKLMRDWIRTTIEDRRRFERLSTELKKHWQQVNEQLKDRQHALDRFIEDEKESKRNLMEKFRALINTKKKKIGELTKSNENMKTRMQRLEKALLEERRTVAALKGQKIEPGDLELADIKTKEEADSSDNAPTTSTTKGAGRGRGRGRGRGKGRGQALKAHINSPSDEADSPVKKEGESEKDGESNNDVEPQEPLPHPQDTYGWDDDQGNADDDEPLIRRSARSTRAVGSATRSSPSSSGPMSTSSRHSSRLDAIAGGALDLIDRVSNAARHRDAESRTHPTRTIKREHTDTSDSALLQRKYNLDTNSPQEESSSSRATRKRQRSSSSDSPSTTEVILPRPRTRLPVFSMRKAGAEKTDTKLSPDASAYSQVRVNSSSAASPSSSERRMRSYGRSTSTSAGVSRAESINEEDLLKELE
ncbi:hypothetical protein EMPS_09748 [Entomortierella parvispora]|uniref:Uncharacterized protein n=1 Tax=Entomortierella parvispora TaxID=205924 RepID=A0A9P3HIJ2_9FUNG|nr:hypothetical protein EMPS_09748 [Entomortierella parvispora]